MKKVKFIRHDIYDNVTKVLSDGNVLYVYKNIKGEGEIVVGEIPLEDVVSINEEDEP